MKRPPHIEKIQKLLELGGKGNPNPHERESAREMAQVLMTRHGLTLEEMREVYRQDHGLPSRPPPAPQRQPNPRHYSPPPSPPRPSAPPRPPSPPPGSPKPRKPRKPKSPKKPRAKRPPPNPPTEAEQNQFREEMERARRVIQERMAEEQRAREQAVMAARQADRDRLEREQAAWAPVAKRLRAAIDQALEIDGDFNSVCGHLIALGIHMVVGEHQGGEKITLRWPPAKGATSLGELGPDYAWVVLIKRRGLRYDPKNPAHKRAWAMMIM